MRSRESVWASCGVAVVRRDRGHVAQPLVVVANQREGAFETPVHGRLRAPLGDAVAVGLIGHLLANRGQGVLAVGVLARGTSRRAWAQTV